MLFYGEFCLMNIKGKIYICRGFILWCFGLEYLFERKREIMCIFKGGVLKWLKKSYGLLMVFNSV